MTSRATTAPSGATLINLEVGDLDILVHRTFSFDRFVDLLRSRENGLVSPDPVSYTDPPLPPNARV